MTRRLTARQAAALGLAPKRSKYHAVPTAYAGVRYASKAEAARAEWLDAEKAAGRVLWWIGQPTFRLGCAENVYRPDFLVAWCGSPTNRMFCSIRAEDVKGKRTAKLNRDVRLWRAYAPLPLWVIERGKLVEIVDPKEG